MESRVELRWSCVCVFGRGGKHERTCMLTHELTGAELGMNRAELGMTCQDHFSTLVHLCKHRHEVQGM